VDAFGSSSIDFLLYCFTYTTNWGEWLRVKEELAFAIKRIVEDEAGAGFAFPSTSIYMENPVEVFQPPRDGETPGGNAPAKALPKPSTRDEAGSGPRQTRAPEVMTRGENTDGSQAAPGEAGAGDGSAGGAGERG
jgi:MscS family membrane protein